MTPPATSDTSAASPFFSVDGWPQHELHSLITQAVFSFRPQPCCPDSPLIFALIVFVLPLHKVYTITLCPSHFPFSFSAPAPGSSFTACGASFSTIFLGSELSLSLKEFSSALSNSFRAHDAHTRLDDPFAAGQARA